MTINVNGPDGTTVRFPDGTDTATINKAMADHFGGSKADDKSFVEKTADGFAHGVTSAANSDASTTKRFLGVGSGEALPEDPNYKPAEVITGLNPLKWNYDQLGQKAAEQIPGIAQGVVGAKAGAMAGKAIGGAKGALIGGILGGAGSYFGLTAGDAAKKDAVARTGDANAEPNASDLTRAGLTSAASGVVQSAIPMRLMPGANKITAVGGQGVLDSIKKYLMTGATGGVGNAAGSAVNQIGNTIGTDKGVQFSPSQAVDEGVGGAIASGVMAAPRGVADIVSATRLRNMGGANSDATAGYVKRLTENAGEAGLGNGINDFKAQEATKAGLRKELGGVNANGFDQDTQNALSLATSGKPINSDHVGMIESADPAAGYLARQLHVAQGAEDIGSYDRQGKQWTGGLSGVADKYAVRPFKAHALIGGGSALFGAHMLGSYGLPTLGAAAGAYGVLRAGETMAGIRSPANSFAERFADSMAQSRLPQAPPIATTGPQAPTSPPPASPWGPRPPMSGPTGPQVPPPGAPTPAPVGPWGPKPLPQQSVPPVAPPAAPTPAPTPAPAPPPISPMALSMLKQQLKQGLPPAPQPAPEVPPAPPAPPAPPPISPMALKMLAQKLKQGLPPEVAQPAAQAPEAPQPQAPVTPTPTAVPTDLLRAAKTLMSGRAKVDAMKAKAEAAPAESIKSAAIKLQDGRVFTGPNHASIMDDISKALGKRDIIDHIEPTDTGMGGFVTSTGRLVGREEAAKIAGIGSWLKAEELPHDHPSKVAASAVKAKITKADGKVESTAPEAWEPYQEHQLYPKDISPQAYAAHEMAAYGARSPKYLAKAENSARARIEKETALVAQHPEYTHAIKGLVRQLHKIGTNAADKKAAVQHYAGHMSPEAGAAVMKAFQ